MSFSVLEKLTAMDAEKMIIATQKVLVIPESLALDTVHLTAQKRNSNVPSQMIQLQGVPFLLCVSQKKKMEVVNTVIINNAH